MNTIQAGDSITTMQQRLFEATMVDDINTVKTMLTQGINIEFRDQMGRTALYDVSPLSHAINNGYTEIVELARVARK